VKTDLCFHCYADELPRAACVAMLVGFAAAVPLCFVPEAVVCFFAFGFRAAGGALFAVADGGGDFDFAEDFAWDGAAEEEAAWWRRLVEAATAGSAT
jgi:hypothetical protein